MSSLPKKKNHMCNKPPVESDHSGCHLRRMTASPTSSSRPPHVLARKMSTNAENVPHNVFPVLLHSVAAVQVLNAQHDRSISPPVLAKNSVSVLLHSVAAVQVLDAPHDRSISPGLKEQ